MFVCPKLIEETGRPPKADFMWFICADLGQVRVSKKNSHFSWSYDVFHTLMYFTHFGVPKFHIIGPNSGNVC